jgi:hypothetical protein
LAFGDYLKNNINMLSKASTKKVGTDAFWEILKRIAVQDILSIYPQKIDSDTAVPIYFKILSENEASLPKYFSERLPSNKQPRYRVINRNLFTSNAFHTDGLANQKEIIAYKEINENKKGERVVYQGVTDYVDR